MLIHLLPKLTYDEGQLYGASPLLLKVVDMVDFEAAAAEGLK